MVTFVACLLTLLNRGSRLILSAKRGSLTTAETEADDDDGIFLPLVEVVFDGIY